MSAEQHVQRPITGEHLAAQGPLTRTGSNPTVQQAEILTSDSGKTTMIKIPFKLPTLRELIPWLIAALFGGDRILADYIDAPKKIEIVAAEVGKINVRLEAIENFLTSQPATSQPAIKGFKGF